MNSNAIRGYGNYLTGAVIFARCGNLNDAVTRAITVHIPFYVVPATSGEFTKMLLGSLP